jgi:TRAP-type uncharacterized transport system substrate-binding protein
MSSPAKPSKTRNRLELLVLFGGSALLAIAGIVVALQFVQPAPPSTIHMAAGSSDGAYFRYAQQYRAILARSDIDLVVLETAGSVDNLNRLLDADDPVELALVQGGIANAEQKEQLSGLGSLFYEPLWLLAPAGTPPRPLNTLAGARIGIGAEDSGTRFLAQRILDANGIDDTNATLISDDLETAASAITDDRLDLMFAVGSADSPLLRRLAGQDAIVLQDLPRAAAYARRDRSLTVLDLPEGTLDLVRNLPDADLRLVAATANLVAHPNLHPALVDLLIEAAAEVHGAGSLFAEPGRFPTPQHGDFPLSADAERHYEHGPPFLQRYLPFWAATWIDRTKVMLVPLLALLLPLVKTLPPVYRWRIRRRILRWYVQLRRIDLAIETGDRDPARLAELKEELQDIESDAARVDVPLSYSNELYNLRLHIQLLDQKLERLDEKTGIRGPSA